MEITQSKLFMEYPRIAPSAYSYLLTYEDVKMLIEKIQRDLKSTLYFQSVDQLQVALKSILARLDFDRDEFLTHLQFRKKNMLPDEELKKECGRYYLEVYKALLS